MSERELELSDKLVGTGGAVGAAAAKTGQGRGAPDAVAASAERDSAALKASASEGIMSKGSREHRYPFATNRACPYFPCHDDLDSAEFNCLFCYCPLYALGPRCGGRFRYTDAGVKDCTPCSLPHQGDAGTELVKRHFKDLADLARVPMATGAGQPAKTAAATSGAPKPSAEHANAAGASAADAGRAVHAGPAAADEGQQAPAARVASPSQDASGSASASDPEARLSAILSAIPGPDAAAAEAARTQWNSIAKPIGSLGMLEDAIVRIAALTGDADVRLNRRICTVFCADNGVVAEGVSQCGSEVTTSVATAIAAGTSSICSMARPARVDTLAVDVGMETPSSDTRVLDRAVRRSTGNIAQGPAMSRAEAARAVLVGVDLVRDLREQGYRIIASGEMGIGNTTTSSAVASVLLDQDPCTMVGRGAGLSDDGLVRKVRAVERALAVNRPRASDPLGTLAYVGGLDIAALCGLFIGGARWRVPIIVDGFISSVAALAAVGMSPQVAAALVPSHVSSEPAAALVMDALGFEAPIHAGLHLGEGTGAVCLIPLLDQACALYHGATFGDEGIVPYEVDLK
ncbi:MAG: nicotinate-nucleotide--dimethylbenzimidazole phosphoribosyltransferase [Eggerthellaceae bacterium]|jgi:nicotinate-nucleotide--dimethylbenzimidazole phosphoribosyltransferase